MSQGSMEERLKQLTEQVAILQERVDSLYSRVGDVGESNTVISSKTVNPKIQQVLPDEGVLNWAGKKSLLPRIASICFLLVFALILRTITDNGFINLQLGSAIGIGYSIALVLAGTFLYTKKSPLAPIFSVCGLILLLSIVLETHTRFESLSTLWAYITLLLTVVVVAFLGLRFKAAMLFNLGTVGVGLVGVGLRFPYPMFSYLGIVLLVANITGYLASRHKVTPSLRWSTLVLAAIFWLFWALKLSVPAAACGIPDANLFAGSFLPLIGLFWITYFVIAILGVMKNESLGFYDSLLPTIVSVGLYWASYQVAVTWYMSTMTNGMIAVALSCANFAVATWFASKNKVGAKGSNSFTFAGVVLLVLGLPAVVGYSFAVPVLSAIAFGLILLSGKWQSGGVRVTSYLLQAAACAIGLSAGVMWVDSTSPMLGSFVAVVISAMSLQQYRWCRINKAPHVNSAYFSWLDKKDYTGAVLLMIGLIGSFCVLQLGLHSVLQKMYTEYQNAFYGGQTVLINIGVVLLLVIGLRLRNVEIIVVACSVALFGAVKVFLFDFFKTLGVPLVLSVFSFGVVAAVGSVVSGRWQKGRPENDAVAEGVIESQ